MGVEPGKGGQLFIESVMKNIKYIHNFKTNHNPNMIIQLDGGVNTDIIKRTHGLIDNYVSGSFLMKQENKKQIFDLVK
jgi:ribulose-phosphate 3-epimerase